MKFKRLSIKDIIEITPNCIIDNRGYFLKLTKRLINNFIGKKINFCQRINQNLSKMSLEDFIINFHQMIKLNFLVLLKVKLSM